MNAYIYCLMPVLIFAHISFCMDGEKTVVKTFDGGNHRLPQHEIEASRLLHTKQQWQLFKEKYKGAQPAPLLLKTISADKVKLFSDALKTKDFKSHFTSLTHENKSLLICVAGEQELDSSSLTAHLFDCCFTEDFVEKNVNSRLPFFDVSDYMKRLVIFDNAERNNFVQTTHSYADDNAWARSQNGKYVSIPALLKCSDTAYDGTNNDAMILPFAGVDWVVARMKSSDKKIHFITSTHSYAVEGELPEIENQINVWFTKLAADTSVLKKVIKHTNAIRHIVFSKDGNYLATSSQKPNGGLILTCLRKTKNASAYSDIFLTGYLGRIGDLCFNNLCFNDQSTVLASGAQGYVQLWDMCTHHPIANLDCSEGMVEGTCFDETGNRLAATVNNDGLDGCTIILWDTSDLAAIHRIKTLSIDIGIGCIDDIRFDKSADAFIIKTYKKVLLVQSKSGEIMMMTLEATIPYVYAAVCMSCTNFLATAACGNNSLNQNNSDTLLWDIKSGMLISTLLKDQIGLSGVGITPDRRCVVSTFEDCVMIKTELFDSNAAGCFDWIDDKSNLLQKYLLLRLFIAQEHADIPVLHPSSSEDHILQGLPTEPNVKGLVERYLLKK